MIITYSEHADIWWNNDKGIFVVHEPFTVFQNKMPLFDVEAGFETDLASIPRIATPLVPKLGHYLQPSIAHDYCYETDALYWMNRKRADEIFYAGMLSQGVRKFQAWLIYRAVRLGGRGRWA